MSGCAPLSKAMRCDPGDEVQVEGWAGLSTSDRVVGTMMTVPLDQIQPYDRNPRRQPNRAYELIKASIEARGFRGVLPITRRPGETHYRVAEGGNTTLAILKALHQGGDQRFGTVPCRFEPWVSESDTLIAHLVEADLGRALSQRALAKALTERGYRLDHSTIVRMDYALDVLLPVIPKALRAGLGRPQVERLRRLHQALERLWQTQGSGDERGFETLFREALARVDSPQWAFKEVRREVEALFAEHTGHAKALIRAELEALLSKGAPPPSEGMAPEVERTLARSLSVATELDLERAASVETPRRVTEDVEDPQAPSSPVHNRAHPRPGSSIDAAPEACETRGDSVTTPKDSMRSIDLKSLRARAWVLATRLAERHGMGHLIKPLSGEGYGYLVIDVLAPNREDLKEAETALRNTTLWWHLVACCEGSSLPLEILKTHLPAASGLRQFCETQDPALLLERVPVLDPSSFGPLLWSQLADADWSDLLGLMDCYRHIRQRAVHPGLTLWQTKTHGCD